MCLTASVRLFIKTAQILHGDDLKDQISGFIDEVITSAIDARVAEGHAEDWDFEDLWDALKTIYPISLTVDDIAEEAGDRTQITRDLLVEENPIRCSRDLFGA